MSHLNPQLCHKECRPYHYRKAAHQRGPAKAPVEVGALGKGKGTTKLKSKLKNQIVEIRKSHQIGAAPEQGATRAQIAAAALARV